MLVLRCISATYHSISDEDTDAVFLLLRWGALPSEVEIGHYRFSSASVTLPDEARVYEYYMPVNR